MPALYWKWKHKYELLISNPSSTANVQVQFSLPYKIGMRADFRDIRFSDKNGKRLYYYIESYTAFSSSSVWVKLPSNDSNIFLYYGNGQAVSESSPENVFDFWEPWNSLSSSRWSIIHGSASVSGGALSVGSATLNSIVESVQTFSPGTLVEARAYHPAINRTIIGFRSTSSQKAGAWHGTVLGDATYKDYRFTHNGSSGTWTSDGVSRGGTTYYTYGVVNLLTSVKHFVNGSLRGTATATLPGNVNLPIHFYSEYNKGNLIVDWVRTRKYVETVPLITLGRKYVQNVSGFLQQRDYFEDEKTIKISSSSRVKDYFFDRVAIKINTGFMIGQPDKIEDSVSIAFSVSGESIIERRELRDYALVSCEISKSISDTYTQLSAQFENDVVQAEEATVKYYAHSPGDEASYYPLYSADGYPVFTEDGYQIVTRESIQGYILYTSDGYPVVTSEGYYIYTDDYFENQNGTLLFWGKVVSKSPVLSYLGDTVRMQAADQSRNLTAQKIPWNYQIVSLEGSFNSWDKWIAELMNSQATGVRRGNIIDTMMPSKQFTFKPGTSRLDAIKEIAEYTGCILNIKLKKYDNIYAPTLYAVPAADIDQRSGGFDLPQHIEFSWPDSTIINEPDITGEQDSRINKVVVHGVLSDSGETTVAAAYTPAVYEGEEKAHEYVVEDNTIFEKGSTAEIEAVKWLLYFTSARSVVSMKFVNRFDLELYQRIRFGAGFSQVLRNLTSSVQLPYVVAYDPRDELNSTHIIDVAGVPRPAWLRISEIKYNSSVCSETCEIKAVTDFIYSSVDPVVLNPYNQYIAPGYYKPEIDDTVATIQDVVSDTIEKQLSPEICTVLAINENAGTAIVQTQSGKLVTVRIS